jgi:hypothetical protein
MKGIAGTDRPRTNCVRSAMLRRRIVVATEVSLGVGSGMQLESRRTGD